MTPRLTNWLGLAVRVMLATSVGYVGVLFVTEYGTCRAGGTDKAGCVISAVLASVIEAVGYALMGIVALLDKVLP
jgi:hypothetical protein